MKTWNYKTLGFVKIVKENLRLNNEQQLSVNNVEKE